VKSTKKRKRALWVAVSVILITALAVTASLLFRPRVNASEDREQNQNATVFVGSLSSATSASGQLLAQREAALSFASAGGEVKRVHVEVGDRVREGQVLVELDTDALGRAVRKTEQALFIQKARLAELLKDPSEEDLAAAKAAVASAQTQLDDLLAGPSDKELADARAAVESAQAQLDDLIAGPSDEQLNQARAALSSAQATQRVAADMLAAQDERILLARQQLTMAEIDLESAKYFYEALANDWQHKDYADFSPEAEAYKDAQRAYDVALARFDLSLADINDSSYRAAQAQVAQAQANLAALTEEKTVAIANADQQLAAAQANLTNLTADKTTQLAAARAQLAQAEANLAKLQEGASEEQIAIAKAQAEQTQVALGNARARLEDAALTAPFDGLVTAVHVAAGERASGRAIELIDPDSIEAILYVDEIDIGGISEGQATTITLESWPDEELEGTVTAIAPKARVQQEIVTYEVHITFDNSALPIRSGMTANADLVTAERTNVLLVPNRAISADRETGTYYVNRVQGNETSRVDVTIGLRDSQYTEIKDGLREGDEVSLAEAQNELPFGPPRSR
jgi:HlyD family secretion protein